MQVFFLKKCEHSFSTLALLLSSPFSEQSNGLAAWHGCRAPIAFVEKGCHIAKRDTDQLTQKRKATNGFSVAKSESIVRKDGYSIVYGFLHANQNRKDNKKIANILAEQPSDTI